MSEQFQMQSLALVGDFLRRWSNMEQTMHLAISAATKLEPLMNTIICANLTMREKLNILLTLVDTSNIEPSERKAAFKSMLRKIGEYASSRNMIAHNFFLPGASAPSVVFMPIKAKGNFDAPNVIWHEADFKREYEKIDAFAKELLQLTVGLEHASFSVERLDLPMEIVGSSARERSQFPQPQENSDSNSATPEIDDEKKAPTGDK
jgi:hypothetical protein